MDCPYCRREGTRVVDSRLTDGGAGVRRRRRCASCDHRFTTFERAERLALVVLKRSGEREPFAQEKILAGLSAATKGRPVTNEALSVLADEVEEAIRLRGPETRTEEIGREVLERLGAIDQVAYMRFASVYKSFDDPADFEREAHRLAAGQTGPSGK